MNKKLFSAALFGALLLGTASTFVSCKDYDDDIAGLQTQINDVKATVSALEAKVNAGKFVTGINSTADGITISLSDGSSYTVTNGKNGTNGAPGADGAPGTVVTIDDEGFFVLDGETMPWKAVTADGTAQVKAPFVNEDGVWVFFDENGEEVESGIKANGAAYAVESNGIITLYVPNEDGEVVAVKLPTAGSTLSTVEILGWAKLTALNTTVHTTNAPAPGEAKLDDNLTVNYAFVSDITKVYDSNKSTTWSAQKSVEKGEVLNTLAPNNTCLLVRIDAGADPADMSFTLKNSQGKALPIALKCVGEYTGMLTRGSNRIYAFALDNTTDVYANATKYTDNFTTGLYSIVEKSGFTSNFAMRVNAVAASVNQGVVAKVDGNASVTDPNYGTVYEVNLNKANKIEFDPINGQYVYDYYVEADDPTIAGMFGFSADKANGTFKVTKLADQVSTAAFDVNVYKLHIDGKIYKETITIKPIRTLGQGTVYDLGDVQIKENGYMTLNIDLTKMFTEMGADATIWQNATLGAQNATVKIMEGDSDETSTVYSGMAMYKNATTLTTTVNEAKYLVLDLSSHSGSNANLDVDEDYVATVTFDDGTNDLNTITIKFTPVLPKLSSFITKRDALWNGNTLMAYFADPAATATPTLASTYDLTKGFTKFGGGTTGVVITLDLDAEQEIGDYEVVGDGLARITSNAITLNTTTDFDGDTYVTVADRIAYGEELNVTVSAKYLTAYDFPEEEVNAAAFKVKVQSALEAGKIVPAAGASIKLPAAAAGEFAKLTADMITGYTYNNQPYSLFQTISAVGGTAAWKYTYIHTVEFKSADNEIYAIVDASGNEVATTSGAATWGTAIAPVWTAPATAETPSFVKIVSKNITNTTTTKITVKVTDMFGYVKTAEIPLTITVGE